MKNIKLIFISIFVSIFFMACGGGSGENSNIDTSNKSINPKNETYFNQQWYINYDKDFYEKNSINPNAHINVDTKYKYSGKGVKIAIIDDGLDVYHEDLKQAIINTYDVNTKLSNVSHSYSFDMHGTAVTGLIASRYNGKGILGLAYNSEIIFLKYNQFMSDSQAIELFEKAQEFGADIINCSWGTYDVSPAVEEKIIDLAKNGRNKKGTIIVFSSGNDDKNMKNDESNIKEVISVGASDKYNLRASYSNYGQNLDLVAPGGNYLGMTTLDPSGFKGVSSIDENYNLANDAEGFVGTSAAAPLVSASIALMLEKNPNLTRQEIEYILRSTASKIGTLNYEEGRNDYYGYGKINLKKALDVIN